MKIYAVFGYGYDLKEFMFKGVNLYDSEITLFAPRLAIRFITHANHFRCCF